MFSDQKKKLLKIMTEAQMANKFILLSSYSSNLFIAFICLNNEDIQWQDVP